MDASWSKEILIRHKRITSSFPRKDGQILQQVAQTYGGNSILEDIKKSSVQVLEQPDLIRFAVSGVSDLQTALQPKILYNSTKRIHDSSLKRKQFTVYKW